MSELIWVLVAIAVIAVIVIAYLAQRRRSLQSRFGPEYDRTVDASDGRFRAESELKARAKRRKELEIKPLPTAARDRYVRQWRDLQTRFVDGPQDTIRDANDLVTTVLRERGYPVESFDQQASDVSVDHPDVVHNYRAAHAISLANDHGKATTEDLRQAMIYYRSLFAELLETTESPEGTIDITDRASGSTEHRVPR